MMNKIICPHCGQRKGLSLFVKNLTIGIISIPVGIILTPILIGIPLLLIGMLFLGSLPFIFFIKEYKQQYTCSHCKCKFTYQDSKDFL